MSEQSTNEQLLDMFLFETSQLLEQLEQSILNCEKDDRYTQDAINEIFRIMHTIKGSAAMMMFHDISALAHSIEDLFFFLREEKPDEVDCTALTDMVLEGVDFIKIEAEKIKNHDNADGKADELIGTMKSYLSALKRKKQEDGEGDPAPDTKGPAVIEAFPDAAKAAADTPGNLFKAVIHFEEGCEMENIRAYTIIHNLKKFTGEITYEPKDIIENDESVQVIRKDGFQIYIKTELTYEKMYEFFMRTIFLKDLELIQLEVSRAFEEHSLSGPVLPAESPDKVPAADKKSKTEKDMQSAAQQSIISVSVEKLDRLMDLVGEMVIAEAMVIQNPDIQGLELDNFKKAAQQLSKITGEIQEVVMAVRMVPLSATFHRMHRIVRDMCKKLDKEVQLVIEGEDTEVDKNIIEHISDPLMHLVRNSIDHGIESSEERRQTGKPAAGTVTLAAKNSGSDVVIIISDDGRGLDRERILEKARENHLLLKDEDEMTDKEVYGLILLPGFSTNDMVTEYSGRGVGMDVVTKNIEAVGGSLSIDSTGGKGTIITLKIPLTLAIIDGMNVRVGNSRYTIPTISIRESFRPEEDSIITDPDGNEMIMVRGRCHPVQRLYELFKVKTSVTDISEGIIIMVEQDGKAAAIFADELVGQQSVVIKALPQYLKSFTRIRGLSGCTLLGDGSISLIIDVAGLINLSK